MSIDTLQQLCLENICSFLYLNYKLCEYNSWKIPYYFGDILFKSIIDIKKYKFNEEQLYIFKNEISSLTSVYIDNEKFKDIENFEFLNKHELNSLSLVNIGKFVIENIPIRITAKKVLLKNVKLFNNNLELLKFFFLNFFIKNSLIVQNIKDRIFFYAFPILIDQTSLNLETFILEKSRISLKSLKLIIQFVKKRINIKNLQIVVTVEEDGTQQPNLWLQLKNELSLFFYDLPSDEYQNIIQNCPFYSISRLLINFENLNIFSFQFDTINFPIQNEILISLTNYNSNNLRELKFYLKNISSQTIQILSKLFSECKYMEKVYLKFFNKNLYGIETIIDSLKVSSKTLKNIYIDYSNHHLRNYLKSVKNLLKQCCSLETIDGSGFFSHKSIFRAVLKSLELSQNSMKHITLSSYPAEQILLFTSIVKLFNYLVTLNLSYSKLTKTSMKNLCAGQSNSNFQLKYLNLYDCQLNASMEMELSKVIKTNKKLEYLNLGSNYLGFLSINLLKTWKLSISNLRQLLLKNCGLTDNQTLELGNMLNSNKNISHLNLYGNILEYDCLNELLIKLKPLQKTLKKFTFSCNDLFLCSDSLIRFYKSCRYLKLLDDFSYNELYLT